MSQHYLAILLALLTLAWPAAAQAQTNWPSFRGADAAPSRFRSQRAPVEDALHAARDVEVDPHGARCRLATGHAIELAGPPSVSGVDRRCDTRRLRRELGESNAL